MLYDCHNHTNISHDSQCRIDDLCECAMSRGLTGIAVTNHCDIVFWEKEDIAERMRMAFAESSAAAEKYRGKLDVLRGIEVGDCHLNDVLAQKIISEHDFDIVVGSVHTVKACGLEMPYSFCDLTALDGEKRHLLVKEYFLTVLNMAKRYDFDVLAHLQCILRYMNGKYGFGIDMDDFRDVTDEILRVIAGRGIALEVNTSSYDTVGFMPGISIVKRFREFGGDKITLGSDSHNGGNVGNHFGDAVAMIKEAGFDRICYYRNRKPVFIKI